MVCCSTCPSVEPRIAGSSLLGQDAQAEVFFGQNRHIVFARITRKS